MNLNGNMDHEESLANKNVVNVVLVEQKQEMDENTATTPHPVADKQKSNLGKKSSDKVVTRPKSALERELLLIRKHRSNILNDYTYEQYMLEKNSKKCECAKARKSEIMEGVQERFKELTDELVRLSKTIGKWND